MITDHNRTVAVGIMLGPCKNSVKSHEPCPTDSKHCFCLAAGGRVVSLSPTLPLECHTIVSSRPMLGMMCIEPALGVRFS